MRLDQLLVHRGLFASREQAKRAVMAGRVIVDEQRVDKAGAAVAESSVLRVKGDDEPFVSRAGRKLAHALETFGIDVRGRVCLDVGASTGGFTDCLLQGGACRVYAVDVGYGQLDLRLRNDSRVVVMERLNARHLAADALGEPVTLVTVDVSFISLIKVVPALLPHLVPGGTLITLIKPQFEAGRAQIGKGGVVRDDAVRRSVIDTRAAEIATLGLVLEGVSDSPIAGARSGNREALAVFRRPIEEGGAGVLCEEVDYGEEEA